MRSQSTAHAGLALVTALLGTGSILLAQDSEPQPASPPPPREAPAFPSGLEVETLQARLAAIQADPGLIDTAKASLGAKYTEAIGDLKAAQENTSRATAFLESIQAAPTETEKLARQLEALPTTKQAAAIPQDQPTESLSKELQLRRAELAEIQNQLKEAGDMISTLKARPVEIGARLPEARLELNEAEKTIAGHDPLTEATPSVVASLVLVQARAQLLRSEIEMLSQERLSREVRDELAGARLALLEQKARNAKAAIAALQELLKDQRRADADRLGGRVDHLAAEVSGGDGALVAMASDLRELANELQDTTAQLRKANVAQADVTTKLAKLETDFNRIESQLWLGGLEGTFSQAIIEQRRSLPNPRSFSYSIKARAEQLQRLGLAEFRIADLFREQPVLEERHADHPSPKMRELLELRRELLAKLDGNYDALVSELARTDDDERSYRNKVVQIRDFLKREMFWRRSSPPVSVRSFTEVPAALGWLLAPEHWVEAWHSLRSALGRRPRLSTIIALVVVLLLAGRRKIVADIQATGQHIRRISTDRYGHTLRGLVGTILLALPLPLALGFLWWTLDREPGTSDWLRGMVAGLKQAALIVGSAGFLMATCRKGGLGIAHFGWSESGSSRSRRVVLLLLLVQFVVLFPMAGTAYEANARHFDSLGLVGLNLSLLLTAIILGRFFRPSDGILAETIRQHPARFVARFRYVWYPLVILLPLALVILSSAGWVVTAHALSFVFLGSPMVIAIGYLVYHLALRWFLIKERRLALEKALQERRARRAAAEHADESIATDEAERELDIEAVGGQTRNLLRSLTFIGVMTALWLAWSASLPLDETLGGVSLFGFSLLVLVKVLLIAVVFTSLTRNLPGLLELAGLRNVVPDAGTRHAIATIGQYAVVATGAAMISWVFQIDWAQFGWIAAALSVGLGFGLQEVVANFVCGIILLFERPIRVGDVVTVDNIDGTVTRIQMRATTITNWDRKEFVVPNKQFITGTLMNWTLTNSINRVVIEVGVAYGSDTRRTRKILLGVAADHPGVLDDPAPLATFEQFADSTLNLFLRCYLPNLDNRIAIITDLHTEIDERFKEAGIEIAFPQQDLHLRSSDTVLEVSDTRTTR